LVADGSNAAFQYLPQNRIGFGGVDGLRPADPGVSIWDQLFASSPRQFTSRDPDSGVQHYGFTNAFTAPNGQTYYADSNTPSQNAAGMGSAYGTDPLWVNAQGNPTYAFRDDAGQLMYRSPGWGQGSFNDPRWGEYVPFSQYEEWAKNQEGFMDKLGGFLPAIFGGALAGVTAPAWLGGAAAEGGLGFPAVEGGMTMAPDFAGMTGMTVGATPYALPPLSGTELVMGAGAGGLTGGVLADYAGPTPGPEVDAGGDTMLNHLGGPGAALGGAAGNKFGDWLKGALGGMGGLGNVLGTLGATGLGLAGINAQTDAMRELQDKQLAALSLTTDKQLAAHKEAQDKQLGLNRETRDMFLGLGAPYRDRLNASYQPGFDIMQADPALQGAMDQSYNTMLRRLSTTGNPFDNPGGLMEANRYVTQNVALPQLNNYRSQLGNFGQLGIGTAGQAGLNSASQISSGANFMQSGANYMQPNSNAGMYDVLNVGLNRLMNPSQDPMAMFQQMQQQMPLGSWGQF
jgi:hypothetical protein